MDQLALLGIETVQQFKKRNPILIKATLNLDEGLALLKTMRTNVPTQFMDIIFQSKQMRHRLFEDGQLFCASCGLEGTIFRVERDLRNANAGWVLNFYGRNKKGIKIPLTWDHIIPKSLFGNSSFDNAQCMCSSCNMTKSSRIESHEITQLKAFDKFKKMVRDIKSADEIIEKALKAQDQQAAHQANKKSQKNSPPKLSFTFS